MNDKLRLLTLSLFATVIGCGTHTDAGEPAAGAAPQAATDENAGAPDEPVGDYDLVGDEETSGDGNAAAAEDVETGGAGGNDDAIGTSTAALSGVSRYYGTGLSATSLNNVPIGRDAWGNGLEVPAVRFRAETSGSLTAMKIYWIYSFKKPGYSSGNGGKIKVTLRPDDGTSAHAPASTVLASLVFTPGLDNSPTAAKTAFALLKFAQPANVVAGKLYHLQFDNIASDPRTNWISIDNIYMHSHPSPMQPTLSDVDWACERKIGTGSWRVLAGHTPALALYYDTNGDAVVDSVQGHGYMEIWAYDYKHPIGGASKARQTMTPHVDLPLETVAVRAARMSGGGALTLRVEKADGTLLDRVSIPSSTFDTAGVHEWVKAALPNRPVLRAGQAYHLVLSAPSGTVYQSYPLRDGSFAPSAYPKATTFSDGRAELTKDGTTWSGWTYWGKANRPEGDLQFYFEVAK